MFYELALFAGAGGGILGGKLLGWRTVCAVELDDYCRRVLMQRQEDGMLHPFPIWDDVRTFDGRPWRGCVDIITGGFPCQDISAAGKGAGIDGERSGLWKEMGRIIGEVRPRYVFVENSPVLTSRGLGVVLGDLAALGYDAEWGVLGAVHAGAPHKRERIWILAYARSFRGAAGLPESEQWEEGNSEESNHDCDRAADVAYAVCDGAGEGSGEACSEAGPSARGTGRRERAESGDGGEAVADADFIDADNGGCGAGDVCGERSGAADLCGGEAARHTDCAGLAEWEGECGDDGAEFTAAERTGWWLAEPDVGRVAHGVAARVDRLRALGNGQVPGVVRLAWRVLEGRRRGLTIYE